jgi:hypothetical protein
LATPTIDPAFEAMADRHLFASWFRDPSTWATWRAFLAALFGLPMTEDQAAAYREHTARTTLPTGSATEAWLICGRRAGKSFILALCAVFLAVFYDYRQFLAPSEVGTILIIATDRRQARNIFRFIRGLLTGVPMLRRMIRRETSEVFELENDVVIEVGTASFLPYAATRSSRLCATKLPDGPPTMRLSQITRFSTRCVPAWSRFQMPCCFAPRAHGGAAVRCGMPTASTSAGTVPSWSGKRERWQ